MKLYDVTLRKSVKDQYIYSIEERKVVSQEKLMITICEMLSRFPDEQAGVTVTQMECDI